MRIAGPAPESASRRRGSPTTSSAPRGLRVAVLAHPCSNPGSVYRDRGDRFSLERMPGNRCDGLRHLRECWLSLLDDTRMRALLLGDQAEKLPDAARAAYRLLATTDVGSHGILHVVFASDSSRSLPSPLTSPVVCSSTG